jgi:predicted O-methyltransferase YrrM
MSNEPAPVTTDLFSDARVALEFFELVIRFQKIKGWVHAADGYLLYRLARDDGARGAIVEIGSWMGLSTAWLAAGSKAAGREPVHAVDVFDGGAMLKDRDVVKNEGTTYHHFVEYLEAEGLFDHVIPIVAESAAAARAWNGGAIRLLFIDGDHRYEAVKQDIELWAPHVAVGGHVVFDDATVHYPGVVQLIAELRADGAHWQYLQQTASTATFRKLA